MSTAQKKAAANDAKTIQTAEEFAREQQEKAAKRDYDLKVQTQRERTSRVLALIWAPATTLMVLGVIAWLAFVVHQISSEHAARQHDKDQQVTVWCYADPNSDRGTSTFTGLPAQVKGLCPDANYPAPSNP